MSSFCAHTNTTPIKTVMLLLIIPLVIHGFSSLCYANKYFPYQLQLLRFQPQRQIFFSPNGRIRANFMPSSVWQQPPSCNIEIQSSGSAVATGTTINNITYLGGLCDNNGAVLAAENQGQLVLMRFGLSGQMLHQVSIPFVPTSTKLIQISQTVILLRTGLQIGIIKIHDSSLTLISADEMNTAAMAADFTSKTGAFITETSSSSQLHFIDSTGKENSIFRLPRYERYSLSLKGGVAGIIASNQSGNSSFYYIIRQGKGVSETGIVNVRPELSTILFDNKPIIAVVRASENGYEFAVRSVESRAAGFTATSLPDGFVEPVAILSDHPNIILFSNGVIAASSDGKILATERFEAGSTITVGASAQVIGDTLILRHSSGSFIFHIVPEQYYLLKQLGAASGLSIALGIAFLAVFFLYRRYRIIRRALNATLEHGGTAIVCILNTAGRLKRTNQAGRALLGLTADVPLGRPFGYYFVDESLKPIGEFIEKAYAERLPLKEQISTRQATPQEFIISATPLRSSLAQFRGLIITGINITEELEKKRLVNWAQLAHDMQTNLSVIRLNAERLTNDGNNMNDERRQKILHQSAILLQKVRDIVTVGRSDDMQISLSDASELCREVMSEFDETMHPHAKILLDLHPCTLECDARKLTRALRNMVENGIKSLKNQSGSVCISCRSIDAGICFSVSDTGAGMSQTVRENILKPYYTTAYHEGGSGIGTMIIQKTAELHHGKIIIESEEGQGTVFSLIIPREYEQKQSNKQ